MLHEIKRDIGELIRDGSIVEDFMGWNNFWSLVPDDDSNNSEQPPQGMYFIIYVYTYILVLEPSQPPVRWTQECFLTRDELALAPCSEIRNAQDCKSREFNCVSCNGH
jgi:hypothetical protein